MLRAVVITPIAIGLTLMLHACQRETNVPEASEAENPKSETISGCTALDGVWFVNKIYPLDEENLSDEEKSYITQLNLPYEQRENFNIITFSVDGQECQVSSVSLMFPTAEDQNLIANFNLFKDNEILIRDSNFEVSSKEEKSDFSGSFISDKSAKGIFRIRLDPERESGGVLINLSAADKNARLTVEPEELVPVPYSEGDISFGWEAYLSPW
jgi:hypothetical protein